MRVTYDPAKRAKTFHDRGLDFEDAVKVFSGVTFEVEDTRRDYGETRMICFGWLKDRLVVIGYTPRGSKRHIFSMRKANDREKARLAPLLEI
ncbi:MAG: BrnT family toxin [Gammaproteobacteria bacterium]|nr:BrnT family toxin [Gammaproteobacteria bacterium]